MEKILKLDGGRELKLRTSVRWLKIYKEQFGEDFLYSVLPAFESLIDLLIGVGTDIADKDGRIDAARVIENLDEGTVLTVCNRLGQLDSLTFVNTAWALSKNADPETPDPDTWMDSFEVFPFDVIVPETLKMILKSSISSKNLNRLLEGMKTTETTESASKTFLRQASQEA